MAVPPMHSGFLEITLVSAQDLHSVSKNMKTYAVVWLQHDENNKQATNVDQAAERTRRGTTRSPSERSIGGDATGTVAPPLRRPSVKSHGVLNMGVSLKSAVEDHSGSLVNGSSLCNSDVGPSASIVAVAIAKGLYTPPVTNPSEEAELIKEWTKKEREKEALERRQMETEQVLLLRFVPEQETEQRRVKVPSCSRVWDVKLRFLAAAVAMKVVGGGKVGRNVETKFVI
ncbi:uncharacterized protein LOC120177366 [Hibiscus syriacus]|uniref:uncharacterized protein LOC120177366 n=1 Tax=Hibiscus syriacus TaxID=106335 RepID=UPI001921886A|nr:uncharacterized protein LOC120177366 [Hibiscus syriacus]